MLDPTGMNGLVSRLMLVIATTAAVSALAVPVSAADWPQWRGPDRDGISTEKDWNPQFAASGPKIVWQKEVGFGFGAVTVADGKAYVMGFDENQEVDRVYCFDAVTGEEKWNFQYKARRFKNLHEGGPAGTPSVADGRVFTIGKDAQLVCLGAEKGDKLWAKDLRAEYGLESPKWGFSGSPLIEGDRMYVDVGVILCLDVKTGQEIWKSKNYGEAYSSPVRFDLNGKQFLATLPEYGLVLLDAKTGREMAKVEWETRYGVNASTPVLVGEDKIFVSTGYGVGCAMFQVTNDGLKELWGNKDIKNKVSTSIHYDGHIYGMDDPGTLVCLDADTGAQQWAQRNMKEGGIAIAGDTLLISTGDGHFVTAKANSGGYAEISRSKVFDIGKEGWIAPSIANGLVYLRGPDGDIKCVDMRK